MAKIIKLKQSDIENIVNEIVDENPELNMDDNQPTDATTLTLGQDADGNYYVFKNGLSGEPEIVAKS
jgi:hypothetical protein